MSRSPLKLLIVLILVVSVFIFVNKRFFDNKISFAFIPKLESFSVFNELSKLRKTFTSFGIVFDLMNKNTELEKNNHDLLSRVAQLEDLKSENIFLKKALKIYDDVHYELKVASIYSWNLNPEGYVVILNKGTDGGISQGDTVVSEDKVLIGTIYETARKFSKILVVTDPRFKIMARVVESSTIGIANGALNQGMHFNLIIHNDEINEGNAVVSSGNDNFPPSLIIGKVDKVNIAEDQLFKKVTIKPAMGDIVLGRVMVLKK